MCTAPLQHRMAKEHQMAQREWLQLHETKLAFEKAGLKDGDLVRLLSWACLSRRLVVTGYQQISIGNDVASANERERFESSHIWRFFHRAFDVASKFSCERSVRTDVDWSNGEFRYRIDRSEDDPRPSCDIECWINWARGEVSCCFDGAGNKRTQIVWSSVLFDAPSVATLTASIKNRPNAHIGRRPTYDWPTFEGEAKRLIWYEGGFHENFRQADCERSMADWCDLKWTQAPAESNIRSHVQIAHQAFEREKAQK